ncbi:hypothetical protein N9W84_00825 [bacterium]|nr:hypothetical protein [bacterium]
MVIILFAINFKIKSTSSSHQKDNTCIAVQNVKSACWSEEDFDRFCSMSNACSKEAK